MVLKHQTSTTMSGEESISVVSETSEMESSSSNPALSVSSSSTPVVSRAGKKKNKKYKNDPHRFEGSGINFNGKFIGFDEISDARGDKLCQEKIQRLKALKRSSGDHKQRIIINVSVSEGIKVIDQKTGVVECAHPVHKISFISRDTTDSRAFGYVYSELDNIHKFYAIKTEKAADQLVFTLRDLFQVVYELKKTEVDEIKKHEGDERSTDTNTVQEDQESKPNKEEAQVPQNDASVPDLLANSTSENNTSQLVEEEKMPNLLDLENELHTIEQGIEQMNTLESMFSGMDDRSTGSSESPILNTNPWSGVQQVTIPKVHSGQGLSQTNPWASALETNNPFGDLSKQPTGVGFTMTTASDVFGSSTNTTTVNTGSRITADLFATPTSVFGTSQMSAPAVSTNLSENSSFTMKHSSAATVPLTQSSNLSDLFSGLGSPQAQNPSQGLFIASTTAQAQSSNLSGIYNGQNLTQVQTPGLTGPGQALGQPGFDMADFQQQTSARTSSLSGQLGDQTSGVAFVQPGRQPVSPPTFGQPLTLNPGFARMPFVVEPTTVQTSSQPFPHVAGTGKLQAGPFYAQQSFPPPSLPIQQTENMPSTQLSQNPFQSAQPTVQSMPNLSSQQVGQQSAEFPSQLFGSVLSNPSVPTLPQRSGVNPYDAVKLQGGGLNTTVPLRTSVTLPVTMDPFADDPFSNASSRHTTDGTSFPDVFAAPDVRSSSWSDFGSDNFGENPFEQTASTEKNNDTSNPTNRAIFSNSPDLFSDLCVIGKKEDVEKPVKVMFAENKPKKTLNQMRTDSPITTTPQQQASHNEFVIPSHHNHPASDSCSASDVNESQGLFSRPSSMPVCNDPWSGLEKRFSERNNIQKESSPGALSSSSGDFNLPSPDEPPPPLPSHIEFVNNIPALPPRPPAVTADKHSKPVAAHTQHASSSHSPSHCLKYKLDRTVEIVSIPRPRAKTVINDNSNGISISRCSASSTETRSVQNKKWFHSMSNGGESPVKGIVGRSCETKDPQHNSIPCTADPFTTDPFAQPSLSLSKKLGDTSVGHAQLINQTTEPLDDFADIFGDRIVNGE